MKSWHDLAKHKMGCPYIGIAISGTEEEIVKYHTGYCPGCNVQVNWEEKLQEQATKIAPSSHITQ